jgi:hypothetical protein
MTNNTHDLEATVTYLRTQRKNRLFGTVELRFNRGEIVQIILHESLKPAEMQALPEAWSSPSESFGEHQR